MKTENEIKELLNTELDRSRVKKHPYSGFDYIQSWDAISTANKVFGYFNWSSSIDNMKLVCETSAKNQYGSLIHEVCYTATVTITVNYIDENGQERTSFRQGSGAGSGNAKKISDAHDAAIKSAESDAEKRALRKYGNQFGLCLYDSEQVGLAEEVVEVNPNDEIIESLSGKLKVWVETIYTKDDIESNPFKSVEGVGEMINSIKPDEASFKRFGKMYFEAIKEYK